MDGKIIKIYPNETATLDRVIDYFSTSFRCGGDPSTLIRELRQEDMSDKEIYDMLPGMLEIVGLTIEDVLEGSSA